MRLATLILSILLLTPVISVTAQARPTVEAGQSVSIAIRNRDFAGTANVVRVDGEIVTLYITHVRRGPAELKDTQMAVPWADVERVHVKTKGELALAYTGLVVLLLIPVVLWAVVFIKYDKEQRRQRFRLARVPLMTFLGGLLGIFIGGALVSVMGLENHELVALGGSHGIPADKVGFIGGMLIFGYIFYNRARKRQDGGSRPMTAEEEIEKSRRARQREESKEGLYSFLFLPSSVCRQCSEKYASGFPTCPHCGHTQWGILLIGIIFGLGVLMVGVQIGTKGEKVAAFIFGGIGVLFLLVDVIWVIAALKKHDWKRSEIIIFGVIWLLYGFGAVVDGEENILLYLLLGGIPALFVLIILFWTRQMLLKLLKRPSGDPKGIEESGDTRSKLPLDD